MQIVGLIWGVFLAYLMTLMALKAAADVNLGVKAIMDVKKSAKASTDIKPLKSTLTRQGVWIDLIFELLK